MTTASMQEYYPGRWVWHPAGSDKELAAACDDLLAGRWGAAGAVLAGCRGEPSVRASRSLVLGAMAAGSDVAETWVREEPGSAEARLVFARAAAARALRADTLQEREALAQSAHRACMIALELGSAWWDATPFVILLSIAHLIHYPRQSGPAGNEDLRGPWDLLAQVRRHDPVGREAHHRMLSYFSARGIGSHAAMWQFAQLVAEREPQDSVLQLLPIAARAEHHRALLADPARYPLPERQWSSPEAKEQAVVVRDGWFAQHARYEPAVPVADLSLLAFALLTAFPSHHGGKQVMAALMPYATRWPWSLLGDPVDQLDRAVARCGLRPP